MLKAADGTLDHWHVNRAGQPPTAQNLTPWPSAPRQQFVAEHLDVANI